MYEVRGPCGIISSGMMGSIYAEQEGLELEFAQLLHDKDG
jgi:hypothetical protein